MKRKPLYLSYALMFLLLLGSAFIAHADDDEDEHEDDEEEHVTVTQTTAPEKEEETEMVTKIITTPATIVTRTVMKNVVLNDTDRDGLTDDVDPHVDIPEQFIVSDTNYDGIDDRFELALPN